MPFSIQGPLSRLRAIIPPILLMVACTAFSAHAGERFELNLERTDIRVLIRTVAEQTGKNFIVDPRVAGEVTVASSQPVDADELYAIFENILSVHGYTAVQEGSTTRVIPRSGVVQQAVPVVEGNGTGDQVVTRVIHVDHVDVEGLVAVLRPLVPEDARLDAYAPNNRLIVTAGRGHIGRIEAVIRRVDRPADRAIEVIRLEHADARDVIDLVRGLHDEQDRGSIAADTRSNSIFLRGDESARVMMRSIIADIDLPMEQGGNIQVRYLRHADAETILPILESLGNGMQDEASTDTPAMIQADPATNALVIQAPPARVREIDAVLRQLDIRRPQVLVEAIIVEATADSARELGVQFFLDGSDRDRPVGLTSFGGSGTNIVQLLASPESIGSGLSLGAVDSRSDFGGLLRVLASDTDNNILSTPSLVTLDNQEAEIIVGQNVPFVTGRFTGGDVGSTDMRSPFQTIERQDVGLSLRVRPQINDGDTVRLEIQQEVSSIAGQAVGAADLVTNKRALETTVLVEDGHTLVLGGLIDDTVRTREERVPLLGSIPILGHLFRYEHSAQTKQNLMVFLRPSILGDAETAGRHSRARYQFMRETQVGRADMRGVMQHEPPVLPELDLPEIRIERN